MKTLALIMGLFLVTMIAQSSYAQQSPQPPTETIKTASSHTPEQQEVINLSNMKWDWMADKKVDSLETLFDDKAMFTHMGGTWGKTQELATIKSGGIWYKKAVVYAVDARHPRLPRARASAVSEVHPRAVRHGPRHRAHRLR